MDYDTASNARSRGKRLGKYTILQTLGSGGSCKVKLAEDEHGNKVALKIMDS